MNSHSTAGPQYPVFRCNIKFVSAWLTSVGTKLKLARYANRFARACFLKTNSSDILTKTHPYQHVIYPGRWRRPRFTYQWTSKYNTHPELYIQDFGANELHDDKVQIQIRAYVFWVTCLFTSLWRNGLYTRSKDTSTPWFNLKKYGHQKYKIYCTDSIYKVYKDKLQNCFCNQFQYIFTLWNNGNELYIYIYIYIYI